MTQEQKARAYDEAREKVAIRFGSNVADEIFSQFEMSDDEKIRKELLNAFQESEDSLYMVLTPHRRESFIAWLEKQGEQNYKIIKGKNYFCVKTHNYAGVEWIKGTKYYASDNYTLVNQGCEYYCSEYSKEEHNNLFEEVKCDGCVEKQGKQIKSYDTCDSSMMDNKKSPYSEKRDFGYFEEKSANKSEPKFKVGDFIVNNISKDVFLIKSINNGYITLEDTKGNIYSPCLPQTEDDYHLWAIQDAKDGDVLCYKDEISLYKHDIKNCTKQETTFGGLVYHCCYDGKRFITDSLYSLTEQDKMDIHPATKEQRDTLIQAMANAGYTFDFEKKELKKIEQTALDVRTTGYWHVEDIEQKSAWSKEDEEYLSFVIAQMKTLQVECTENEIKRHSSSQAAPYYGKIVNWLKSLKERVQPKQEWSEVDEHCRQKAIDFMKHPDLVKATPTLAKDTIDWIKSLRLQTTWKPNEEQMTALKEVIDVGYFTSCPNALETLYDDLRKLRDE